MSRGFTLIELLVVISIIGLLASIVLAGLSAAHERGRIGAGMLQDSSIREAIGDQLISEWTFDNAGAPYADTSGMNNNGTCTACPSYSASGGFDGHGAESFSGSQYISVHDPMSSGTYARTVTAWVYPTVSSGRFEILNLESTFFNMNNNGEVCLHINGANAGTFCSNKTLKTNAWNFVAATYTGTVEDIYIDGAFVGTLGSLGTPTVSPPGAGSIGVCIYCGTMYFFQGTLDNIRFYTETLTASAIQDLYIAEAPAHQGASTNP